jgi:histidinol-phosphate phosphatase family protein
VSAESGRKEHLFIETDGQVYLVRDRGRWRFPRASEALPFDVEPGRTMDFGSEVVRRVKPRLSHHPEDWFSRDDLFSRADVDPLVTKAVYMTMGRLVAEVVVVRRGRVLMEKAARGFSKGHWNLPGGFLEFGEAPEEGARRETEEELGVPLRIDGLLDTYVSGFPGKPTFTYGFVYHGTLLSDAFLPKADEVEAIDWWPAWRAIELTRNPFAKWAIADAYRRGLVPALRVRRHQAPSRKRSDGPVIFLDRDGTINRDREGAIRTPAQFAFGRGVKEALRTLQGLGYRLAVISNQDAVAWGWITERDLRRIHAKLLDELSRSGILVENVYYCPHELEDGCACRKPKAGMLLAACKDLGVCPRDTWMVGDRSDDALAGKAIGALTALVGDAKRRDGNEDGPADSKPDIRVDDLTAFAKILKSGRFSPPTRPAYA